MDFNKKLQSLELYGSLASPAMNVVDSLKLEICDFFKNNFKKPSDLHKSNICSENDALKIFNKRTDYLTLDFLFKTVENYNGSITLNKIKVDMISKIGIDTLKKFSHKSDMLTNDYFIETMTIERLVSILDILSIINNNKLDVSFESLINNQ